MPFVYLVYQCDGWGHSILVHAASGYTLACLWVRSHGGKERDATAVMSRPHDQVAEPGGEVLIAGEAMGNKYFQIKWAPVDADYVPF